MNSTLAYCAASETADMWAWPTKFSITTSAELTAALNRFCSTMGMASFAILPYSPVGSPLIWRMIFTFPK